MSGGFRHSAASIACAILAMAAAVDPVHSAEPAVPAPAADADAKPPAPLTPPPGISIIPSPPPQYDKQVPGCSVRQLKPLELIV